MFSDILCVFSLCVCRCQTVKTSTRPSVSSSAVTEPITTWPRCFSTHRKPPSISCSTSTVSPCAHLHVQLRHFESGTFVAVTIEASCGGRTWRRDEDGSLRSSLIIVLLIRYLQSSNSVRVLRALLPVGMLDVRRVGTQRPLCAVVTLWSSFWTSGRQYPQSVRHRYKTNRTLKGHISSFSFPGLMICTEDD